MSLVSANVRVAVTGVVSCGPTTSDAPTSSASTLDTDLVDLGYVGDGGVTESRARSTKDIKAWQNGDTVRTTVTDAKFTVKFVLIETKAAVLEVFYGTTTTGATSTDGKLAIVPTATGGRKSWVIDVVDGSEDKRIYLPSGEVTEVGDVVYANGEPIGYEITVTGYPVSGVTADIWSTALKTG